jgi:cell division protein FtsQ
VEGIPSVAILVNNYFENTDPKPQAQTPEVNAGAPSKKKHRGRRIFINVLAGLAGAAIITLIVFSGNKQNAEVCWKVEVEIQKDAEGNSFISEREILSAIQSKNDSLVGKKVVNIPIQKIHSTISKNACVKEAQVYTTVDGRLKIKIDQRTPIARAFNNDGTSFYIDKDGFVFPVTGSNALKLPVFVGNIQEKMISESVVEKRKDEKWAFHSMLDDMYYLTMHLRTDEFLMAQVDHVFIDASRNVQIVPRVGDHRIYVGAVKDLNKKFKKLKKFYASALETQDLNAFSSIHLEYEGQVVCEKKLY